jgi:ribosome recycling factor
MTQDFSTQAKQRMADAEQALGKKLSGLRTGRATPALLEPITIEAYGGRVPLSQVGTTSVSDARLLVVQVWDGSVVSNVEKALRAASFNPIVEGNVLRVPLPDLTQERREELVKMGKTYTEEAKIGLRTIRRDVLDTLDKAELPEDQEHAVKKEIQKLTDEFSARLEALLADKEKEIRRV